MPISHNPIFGCLVISIAIVCKIYDVLNKKLVIQSRSIHNFIDINFLSKIAPAKLAISDLTAPPIDRHAKIGLKSQPGRESVLVSSC
ncbi:hypothetical protein [Chamaesiphon sp. GL140_3_metabinner_50]|uniref:hypothetical protein n=1 Tax=Chamaesiphon sp. GL140_3_metabinner_50 TaxID=2970812 RepID=UPI0025FB1098|nr:hypothetical protein [Chamaesiphon sp. GL140_3_metabinner_50]